MDHTTDLEKEVTADHKRELAVYKYLLSFTNLGLQKDDTINKLLDVGAENLTTQRLPNETLVATQWNYDNDKQVGINRVYVRRVLRYVYGSNLYKKNEKDSWSRPSLGMARLVSILSSLEKYWNDKSDLDHRSKLSKVTHSVKSKALQMFSELSFEEREALNLPIHAGEGLIAKLHEDITNPSYSFRYEDFIRIYEQFLVSNTMYYPFSSTDNTDGNDNIDNIIDYYISSLTNQSWDKESSDKLRTRILKEIHRIQFQSGAEQIKSISNNFNENIQIKSMSNKRFLRNLTKCIIENEGMTNELPIGIKFFEIEKVRPLPLSIYDSKENPIGLINNELLEKNTEIGGLERQYTYKVTLHFCVWSKAKKENKIDFFEEVTGIGSPVSHAMIAMDRVLMWDIPCLREYFPVVKKQFSNDLMIGGNQNSPIWSHCIVQIYSKAEIITAINSEKSLEKSSNSPMSHHGEYCGFDALESSIKSAFIARLRAIKHILKENNVSSEEYINQLRDRVKEYDSLSKAKSLLQFYPFSLVAMKAKINSEIFDNCTKYRTRNEQQNFVEINHGSRWSSVAYDAHLKITEALIKEGRTVQTKKYLSVLDTQIEYLSSLMLARYYVCYGQYHFLSDLNGIENDNPDRKKAISESERYLKLAEDSLNIKLKECELLGEISHSNTHPFFEIYSRISLTRARLYLYFTSYVQLKDNSIWGQAKAPLIEAEKARIYSSRDGNTSLYSSQSCFQSWTYLILAFTWDFERDPKEGFSKQKCIEWSNRLLKHAIICYEEIGIRCYSDIKKNAGFLSENQSDNNVRIDGIPFIQEIAPNSTNKNKLVENILDLNLDLFKTEKINKKNEYIKRPIFFGSDSSNIIFTDGMIELCDSGEDSIILSNMLSAMRKFVVAWSTSRDGALCQEVDGIYHIKQIFQEPLMNEHGVKIEVDEQIDADLLKKIDLNNDRYIRGFYPHRISKTAVFSKLFIGVCLIILKCRGQEIEDKQNKNDGIKWSNISWYEICEFIKGLHEKDIPENPLVQERFNGHLADHISLIIQYFERFEEWSKSPQSKTLSLAQVRDKVVKDIFLLIRGRTTINP